MSEQQHDHPSLAGAPPRADDAGGMSSLERQVALAGVSLGADFQVAMPQPAALAPPAAPMAPMSDGGSASSGAEAQAVVTGPTPAEEMSYGLAGLEPPPMPAQAAQERSTAKPRRQVRFVEAERERVVPIAHAVECDGVVIDSITVRRLTVGEYREHFATPADERGVFPCFFDSRGEAVPIEVLDALSFDDAGNVNEAYAHFLPASFRADPGP